MPVVLLVVSMALMTVRDHEWLLHLFVGSHSDFANLWFAGQDVLHGVPVYDVAALTKFAKSLDATVPHANFVYPPFVLFVAVALAKLPLWLAFPVWNALSLLLFAVAARPYARGLILITPAALICLCFGQYGLIIGALWFWAWRLHPWAVVLLTTKPHIGFLAGYPFLREPRRLIVPLVLFILLIAASVAAFGFAAWSQFFAHSFGGEAGLVVKDALPVLVLQAVTPMIGYGPVGALLYAGAAIIIVWGKLDVFRAATATFLISPYGLHYDLTVVCLGFGLLLIRSQLRWFEQIICLLAFFAPFIVGYGTWLVPPVLLLGLWVQCRLPPLSADRVLPISN